MRMRPHFGHCLFGCLLWYSILDVARLHRTDKDEEIVNYVRCMSLKKRKQNKTKQNKRETDPISEDIIQPGN